MFVVAVAAVAVAVAAVTVAAVAVAAVAVAAVAPKLLLLLPFLRCSGEAVNSNNHDQSEQ